MRHEAAVLPTEVLQSVDDLLCSQIQTRLRTELYWLRLAPALLCYGVQGSSSGSGKA